MKNAYLMLIAALVTHAVRAAEISASNAPDPDFALGVRSGVQLSNQSPIEDLSGLGVVGRIQLAKNREFGLGIDVLSDDIDDPAGEIGLALPDGARHPSTEIMADVISVWGQQNFDVESARFRPFALIGLALSSIHMDTHKGQLADGTQYDLRTNAGTEHIFMAGGGVRLRLAGRLELETAIRGEYHLANWTIEDRVSGAYVASDDYPALAAYLGLSAEF